MIYFVRDGSTGNVKIGFSENPWSRLIKMQSDCPGELTLMAAVAGDREGERSLHRRFDAHRVRGEWFAPNEELLSHIAALEPFVRAAKHSNPDSIHGRALRYSEACGVPYGTARAWLGRAGYPPGKYWSAVVDAGLSTFAEMAALASARQPRRRSGA